MKRLIVSLAVLVGLISAPVAQGLDVPARPPLETPVIDQTNTLSKNQISSLSDRIAKNRGEKDFQLGVLMIPTLGSSESLEDYSLKVAREWGIGAKDKNNGVLLFIAKNDRKIRIEVGSGLEGDLTDLQSKHVIDDVLAPKFRTGDFYGGIGGAIDSISALVQGEADPNANAGSESESVSSFELWMFAGVFSLVILQWIVSILARTKSWWAGGVLGAVIGLGIGFFVSWALWSIFLLILLASLGVLLDRLVSKNFQKRKSSGQDPAWWAGGTTLGGSGGGSFGGGGFSGGGASGGW